MKQKLEYLLYKVNANNSDKLNFLEWPVQFSEYLRREAANNWWLSQISFSN